MTDRKKRRRPMWRRRLGYRLQAAIIWMWLRLLGLLSPARAARIGGGLMRRLGPLLPQHRRAAENMAAALPELDAAQRHRVLLEMWDGLGQTLGEYPHLHRFHAGTTTPGIDIVGGEHLVAAAADPKGCIIVSGHLANWEVLGFTAALLGVPLSLVYRAPNNPYADKTINRIRGQGSRGLIPKGPKGARMLLADMAARHPIGMLIDQKMNDGIPVPFFGRIAMTSQAVPQLAQRFGCKVLIARPERLGPARFRVTILPPLDLPVDGNGRIDRIASMTLINGMLEQWIRERPAEWLWIHRRWPRAGDRHTL